MECGCRARVLSWVLFVQPTSDAYPLMDSLLEYRGLLSVYPDVLKMHEVRLLSLHWVLRHVFRRFLTDGFRVRSKLPFINKASLGFWLNSFSFYDRLKTIKFDLGVPRTPTNINNNKIKHKQNKQTNRNRKSKWRGGGSESVSKLAKDGVAAH